MVAVICDNRTTAMTGFQPHPGSDIDITGRPVAAIDIAKLVTSAGAKSARVINPYNIPEVLKVLNVAAKEKGVSVIIASEPCYLLARREGTFGFTLRQVDVNQELCNGCKICIDYFGCPAIRFGDGKATIDQATCVQCGMCVDVCKRKAIT
jgi:indolepyruvate ferredoxin oxidoreductase alpha subunit